jgi:hypothetical protein
MHPQWLLDKVNEVKWFSVCFRVAYNYLDTFFHDYVKSNWIFFLFFFEKIIPLGSCFTYIISLNFYSIQQGRHYTNEGTESREGK